LTKEWYDIVDTFHAQNRVMHDDNVSENAYIYLLKVKDKFRNNIIKAGYFKTN